MSQVYKFYNPQQARDRRGRWTKTGSGFLGGVDERYDRVAEAGLLRRLAGWITKDRKFYNTQEVPVPANFKQHREKFSDEVETDIGPLTGLRNNALDESIYGLLVNLPAEHRKGLKRIQYGSKYDVARRWDGPNRAHDRAVRETFSTSMRESVLGFYHYPDKRIFIVNDKSSNLQIHKSTVVDSFTKNVAHEIGHHVHTNPFVIKSLSVASEIDSLFEKAKKVGTCVSRYAATDEREYFAESYAAYVTKPALLKARDGEMYAFLRRKVFSGIEYSSAK